MPQFTTKTFSPFIGGQFRMENSARGGYLFCGKITGVTVRGNLIEIWLEWSMKKDDFPQDPNNNSWTKSEQLYYVITMTSHTRPETTNDGRITLYYLPSQKLCTFSPPHHASNIDFDTSNSLRAANC